MTIRADPRGINIRRYKMEQYEKLADAIILLAANDYRAAIKKLKSNLEYRPALLLKHDCETFFRSEWFGELTSINGNILMERLREETK